MDVSTPALVLLLVAATVRVALAGVGYLAPRWLQVHLGAPIETNVQLPYLVRVWAIRDVVLGVALAVGALREDELVLAALVVVIVIDAVDIASAWLARRAGLFSPRDAFALATTAIAALVPEVVALALVLR